MKPKAKYSSVPFAGSGTPANRQAAVEASFLPKLVTSAGIPSELLLDMKMR